MGAIVGLLIIGAFIYGIGAVLTSISEDYERLEDMLIRKPSFGAYAWAFFITIPTAWIIMFCLFVAVFLIVVSYGTAFAPELVGSSEAFLEKHFDSQRRLLQVGIISHLIYFAYYLVYIRLKHRAHLNTLKLMGGRR